MSALTEEQLKAEKLCKDALKAMNSGSKSHVIQHIANLQIVELERLMEQSDSVKLHRAQGAAKAYQSIIELLAEQ